MRRLLISAVVLGVAATAACEKPVSRPPPGNSVGNVASGPNPYVPTPPVAPQPPLESAPCADTGTFDTIKDIVFEGVEKMASAENRLTLIQIKPQTTVRVELPLFEGKDKETDKTNCEGRLHVVLPYRAGATNNDLTQEITYYVQPAADGSGNVVGVSGVSNLQASLAVGDLSPWASTSKTVAGPELATPATSVATAITIPPGTPTYQTSFNCAKARGFAEVTVCTDPELAADDVRLSSLYLAKVAADTTGQVKSAGRVAWNARRRCADRGCLVDWYTEQAAAYQ